jgi:hypothetical protein
MPVQDISGQRFGHLVAVRFAYVNEKKKTMWHCRCECGKELIVGATNLKTGNSKSCGCIKSQVISVSRTTHGKSGTAGYQTFFSMINRCTNPTESAYKNYGGRGITVCDRWLEPGGYERFVEDMGPRPPGMTIERVDNEKGYSPDNCVWADLETQGNNRRNNVRVTWEGREMTLTQACALVGKSFPTVWHRLSVAKWPLERALTQPIRDCGRG